MSSYRALAPAKINLGLFLGPPRERDGRHELVSVMQSISLADELTLEPAAPGATRDQVICPGLAAAPEQNLAALALHAFRASTGWDAPPLRLSIEKRIPVAAGLGGGSADAAATLRLARRASGLGDAALLQRLAIELGADVPAQIAPGRWLASGVGELLQELPGASYQLAVLVLPAASGLSTAAVYGEADRLGAGRPQRELEERSRALAAALAQGAPLPRAPELLHNDLQRAAVSLCPAIAEALAQAREAGAEHVLVSGSGPTVIGLITAPDGPAGDALALAELAAASLAGRVPAALSALAVDAGFAAPVAL